MSRHGYSDDLEQQSLAMWRGRVASATRGKRGQTMLREIRDALDAMPVKRLIVGDLVRDDGDVCTLGALGVYKKVPGISEIDPSDHDVLAATFDVAECLIQEIEYENDESWHCNTPEQRWAYMRRWVEQQIKQPAKAKGGA